jgi:streptogramin lyase
MIGLRQVAALALCGVLAGCGGGGSGVAVTAPPVSTDAAAAGGGNVTLTIVYPANFHQIGSASHASASRSAAYVNPSAANYLHVYYVSGSQIEATPPGGVAVNPSIGTNAQTLSVNIPAGSYSQILATETNGSGTILASGASSISAIKAGYSTALSITMSMNAQSIVLTTDPVNASDGVLLSSSSGAPTAFCAKTSTTGSVYAFPADPSGGFITPGTAVGGTSTSSGAPAIPPVVISAQSASDTSKIAAGTLGFATSFAGSTSTISATFGVTDPVTPTFPPYLGYATLAAAGTTICPPSASWNPSTAMAGNSATLTIVGGTPGYSVSVSSGSCPTPSLVTTTTYTDTPAASGTCTFTVTDSASRSTSVTLHVTALASGTITEYGGSLSTPFAIAAGPDGNLWFTEFGSGSNGKIGKITTAGVITEYGGTLAYPLGITAGPDGNLWFVEGDVGGVHNGKIGKITTAGVITEYGGALGNPNAIAKGSDGNLWFTEGATGSIGKITTLGVITEFSGAAAPSSITPGPDGNLWFSDSNRIGTITTGGVITEYGPGPINLTNGITAGPDGNLWFTDLSNDAVGKITTAGVITEFSGTVGGGPQGIVAGPDGNLWFAEDNSGKIGRITTSGVITEYGGTLVNPYGITAGPDGNLWFTEENNGKIGKIVP